MAETAGSSEILSCVRHMEACPRDTLTSVSGPGIHHVPAANKKYAVPSPLPPDSRLGPHLQSRSDDKRHGRGGHRDHNVDPAIPRLRAACRPSAADGDIRLDPADHPLCHLRNQPRARGWTGRGSLADDGRRNRQYRPAGNTRIHRGRNHPCTIVWSVPALPRILPARLLLQRI